MSTPIEANFHTHTTFCDGHNSAEEMVVAAINKGFTTLGFSAHAIWPFAKSWHMKPENYKAYIEEINRLKLKYEDKITIYLGFEADYFAAKFINDELSHPSIPDKATYSQFNPDFIIGSVHYLTTGKGYFTVDSTADKVKANLINLYGDLNNFDSVNGKKAVCDYFDAQIHMLKKGDIDILGHPDLIRIRNSELHFFDEAEGWYKKEIARFAKEIAKSKVIVEINTGGIARGNMKDTYPSLEFLSILNTLNVPVCINSDAHTTDNLDAAFDYAVKQALDAGYKELTYPKGIKIQLR
ncbi:MAG: histidinol-phosphatase [Treponema sp.]|nr:histidinol-phosphatase [Treponema sp.]